MADWEPGIKVAACDSRPTAHSESLKRPQHALPRAPTSPRKSSPITDPAAQRLERSQTLALTGAALAVDTETNTTGPHPLITPFSGQTATITQLASGDTRIYYTADDGGIWQIVAHGPFNKAGSFQGNTPLVPANEVHPCSPVVVTSVDGAFADVSRTTPRNRLGIQLCLP